MSLQSIAAAAASTAFQARCKAALWQPAQDILNESPSTANHVARIDWATKVFRGGLNLSDQQIAVQVLRNSTIAALADPTTADDSAIIYQISVVLADLIAIG